MRPFHLRRLILYSGIFFLALVVQFCWMKYLAPGGLAPNMVLILVILIGLMRGSFAGEMMGFFLGLSWDIVSVDLFGSHAFMLTLIGYLAGMLSRKWNEQKVVTQMILTGIASVFFSAGIFVLYQIFSPADYAFKVNYLVILQPLYNMLVAPAVFKAGEALGDLYGTSAEEY